MWVDTFDIDLITEPGLDKLPAERREALTEQMVDALIAFDGLQKERRPYPPQSGEGGARRAIGLNGHEIEYSGQAGVEEKGASAGAPS